MDKLLRDIKDHVHSSSVINYVNSVLNNIYYNHESYL